MSAGTGAAGTPGGGAGSGTPGGGAGSGAPGGGAGSGTPGGGAGSGTGPGRGPAGAPGGDLGPRLLAWLAARREEAFFLSEVEAGLRREGAAPAGLRQAVDDLEEAGRLSVARYVWDDPHLPMDGFILVTTGGRGDPGASARLEAAWGRWLKEFLASHRCM